VDWWHAEGLVEIGTNGLSNSAIVLSCPVQITAPTSPVLSSSSSSMLDGMLLGHRAHIVPKYQHEQCV
jgi:hypothetical protein